jgi:polyhydroxybutyrate depolymerase
MAAPPQADASPGCTRDALAHGRRREVWIDVDGTRRVYLLDVPDTIEPHRPVALLLDFHGFGHSAAGVWNVSRFKDLSPEQQFITVYPDGLPVHLLDREAPGWDIFSARSNREVRFVTRMLDEIEGAYCIDRRRVYSTGFSNGAFLSSLLACALPDRLAAIAPVAGGQLTLPCAPDRGVPVIIHHGRNDALIDVQQARALRDTWVRINHCRKKEHAGGCEIHSDCRDGVEVHYCEDDSTHTWPPPATQRIWTFLSRYSLPAASGAYPATPDNRGRDG